MHSTFFRRVAVLFAILLVTFTCYLWLRRYPSIVKSPSARGLYSLAGGNLSAGGKVGAINAVNPQLPSPARVIVHQQADEAPDWALAYGQEFWRRTAAPPALNHGLIPGAARVSSGINLGDVIDRVTHAFSRNAGTGTVELNAKAYRATISDRGFALFPFRPPQGADELQTDADASAEFRTLAIRRNEQTLFRADASGREWSVLGNTAQAPLDHEQKLVEHYEARREGMEVTWLLRSPVPGRGDLVIEAELNGLSYAGVSDDGIHFADATGIPRVRVGRVLAVDAADHRVEAASRFENGRLVVTVPAAFLDQAVYPVAVDPSVGPEFGLDTPVLTNTYENQFAPVVAANGTNFLVVWTDARADGVSDIFGARVDDSGVILDVGGIPICTVPGTQDNPAVAANGSDFFVVWNDSRSGTSTDVYGARVGADGVVQDTNGFPVSARAADQFNPAIASVGGDYLVVWADLRNGSTADIYGARVGADGVVRDTNGIAICTAANVQGAPAVAGNGSEYLVVWQDKRGGSSFDIYGGRVDTTGAALDADGVAISTAANDQKNPAVAASGADFLVAWLDFRNGVASDIYGSRVDATGAVLDPAGVAISRASDNQANPAIASNGDGYLVVWEDRRNGSSTDIYGARVDTTGAVIETNGIAITKATLNQLVPSVAWNGGHYLVAWEDYRSSLYSDIFAARLTGDGVLVETNGFLLSSADNKEQFPALAWNGSAYLVTWTDYRRGSGADIYGVRIDGTGTPLDLSAIKIAVAGKFFSQTAVASVGSDFLVVWEDTRNGGVNDILGARVAGNGTLLDSNVLSICTAPGEQFRPAVAANGTDYLVVWGDFRNNVDYNIWGARVAADGTTLDTNGIPISTAPNLQFKPKAAWNGASYLVVWRDCRNNVDICDIYGARLDSAGTVLDPGGIAICTNLATQFQPVVATDGAGFLVAWEDNRTGGFYDILAARVDGSGTLLDTNSLVVSKAAQNQRNATVAWDGFNYVVAWQDMRGNAINTDIYAARVTAGGFVLDTNGVAINTTAGDQLNPVIASTGAGTALIVYQSPGAQLVGRIAGNIFFDNENHPPAFTSAPGTDATEDLPYTYAITTTDPEGDARTITAPVKPAWLTLVDHGNGTASLAGTPRNADGGPNQIVLQVTDGGAPVQQSFTINVANVDDPPVITSTPLTAATEDVLYNYTLTATDEEGAPLTLTAPTLPGFLTIADHGDGTATLSGTPLNADGGDHEILLQVTDGNSTVSQAFTLHVSNVNDPPVITSTPGLGAMADQPYAYAMTATDEEGAPLTFTAPVKPGWLTFVDHGDGTATLSGTPLNTDGGNHNVRLEVTDGATTVAQTFTIHVATINHPPVITSTPIVTATEDQPYAYTITVTDVDHDTLIITAPTRPAWLGFVDHGDGTATLSGTPLNADGGDRSVVVQVSDGTVTASQTYTLQVNNVNDPPVVTSSPVTSAVLGEAYDYTFAATDEEGVSLAITAPTLPAFLSFVDHGDGTATLSGTPQNTDLGSHAVSLQVTDGNTPVTQNFTLRVFNRRPAFTSTPVTNATEDLPYDYAITASDPENDALTITATNLPAWLTLVDHGDGTATLSGVPLNADGGTNQVVLEVSDGGTTRQQSFELIVTNVNDAPIITSAPVRDATEDTAYSYTLTATDEEGDPLIITAPIRPGWLAFVDHGDGTATLSGTPLNADGGSRSVVLRVTDGHSIVQQSFTLTVTNVNDPPVVTSTPPTSATEDQPYSYLFTATDEEGDHLIISAPSLPSWLMLEDHGDGTATLDGTPLNADGGDTLIQIVVKDGVSVVLQSFVLHVVNVNDPPVITSTPPTAAAVGNAYSYTLTATDQENDALIFSAPTKPAWLTLVDHGDGTATLSGTPSAGNAGAQSVTLQVSDGSHAVAQSFTINVSNTRVAPTITSISRAENGDATVCWTSVSGKSYQLRYKDDLNDPDWIVIGDPVTATGAQTCAIDDLAITARNRFYRVVLLD